MEVALVASFLNTFLPKLTEELKERKSRQFQIKIHIDFIKRELELLAAAIDDHELSGKGTCSREVSVLVKQARELARDTEDCIYLYLYPTTASPRLSSKEFAMKIEAYRNEATKLYEKLSSPTQDTNIEPQDQHVEPSRFLTNGRTLPELLELVQEKARQPSTKGKGISTFTLEGAMDTGPPLPSTVKRRVISIVGFDGIGKTRLAKEVHEHTEVRNTYNCRAMVTASVNGAEEVLEEILKQVAPASLAKRKQHDNLSEHLAKILRRTTYLIIIDDMRTTGLWNRIESAFPDSNFEGRIIMTTTIQSVANACSSSNRYVYKLPPLDEKEAEELFLQKPHPTLKVSEAAEILKKCEGLPLAVVSMSEFWKTQKSCEDALRNLGAYLVEKGDILSPNRMRRVLVNKYISLPSHDVKACLLYFCMFPCDNPARRNSLIRRWLAEGFAAAKPKRSPQQVAGDQLKDLIDRNIIQSMEADTNGNVKRCRPHGIMLEYISYKSMYENFAALMPPADHIRRLFLHQSHATDDKWVSGIKLSRVRTLAVSGRASESILEFDKYHLLGVLDLKDSDYQLNTRQLEDICKLLLLKYLSLGNLPEKKNKLPRQMRRLLLLETLEVKKNEEPVGVYEEIIKIPKLKHLIGKFELLDNPGKDLENFMSKDSVLETLSGFVIGKSKGFPRLMSHMGQLRKVKIWCDANADDVNLNNTSFSIKKFTHRGMEMGGNNRSLSIDFAKYSAVVLESLQDSGSLGSLKLRGNLREFLPPSPHEKFVTKVKGVKELCLSSTNLSGVAILAALSKLDVLKYLKLVEDHLGSLVLTTETFKGLERLCLVCLPKLDITINNGALLDLVSLHILCEALAGVLPAGVQIGSLKKLNEIALLDSAGVTPAVKKELKASAMKHSNRPDVLFIKKSTPQVQSVPPASALPNGFVQQ